MQHFWSLDDVYLENTWLTIGSFDGVHRGHQKIARKLAAEAHAHNAPAVVLTFHPHPSIILQGHSFPFYLSTPEERASLLGEQDIDVVITCSFDQRLASTPARAFMETLNRHLDINHLRVGYDFALGKDREGDIAMLRQLGREWGYTLQKTRAVVANGDIISSSRIRFLLGAGKVREAGELLGRNYSISGEVVPGDHRGRSLGFPTANLNTWPYRAIPAAGVYVCRASIGEKSWGAVTNIGVRPTFEREPVPPRVEAHLLDFDGNLYTQKIHLAFLSRLRGERKFSGPGELIEQIEKDVHQARRVLNLTA
jgi:riboflavin kinase/FMN adenylyltransferase